MKWFFLGLCVLLGALGGKTLIDATNVLQQTFAAVLLVGGLVSFSTYVIIFKIEYHGT